MARLTGADEATIRIGVALLLAGLIEAGSALGFTLVAVATPRNPPLGGPTRMQGPVNTARRRQDGQRGTLADALERWVQTRLKVDAAGSIPAREAYADFCRWARAAGIEPCTETRFGRDFSATIVELGGTKVKRRDRTYYVGVSLVMDDIKTSAPLRAAAQAAPAANSLARSLAPLTSLPLLPALVSGFTVRPPDQSEAPILRGGYWLLLRSLLLRLVLAVHGRAFAVVAAVPELLAVHRRARARDAAERPLIAIAAG